MKAQQLIQQLLKEDKIVFVDGGAMGGVKELPLLSPWISAIAFEPNPEEFFKLKNGLVENNAYSSLLFFEQALGDSDGYATLHVNKRASFSSLLKTNNEGLGRHLSLTKQYTEWVDDFKEQREIKVKTITLDSVVRSLKIDKINYLKLDTQGSELLILNGAKLLLANHRINVVKCEVNFVSVYDHQCLFSDIELFLRKNGFEFVDCIFYPNYTYEIKTHTSDRLYDRPRHSQGGDAIFVNRANSDHDQVTLLKTGLILAELKYFSLSHHFLKLLPLSDECIDNLFRYFINPLAKDHFKSIVKAWTPPILLDQVRRILFKKR